MQALLKWQSNTFELGEILIFTNGILRIDSVKKTHKQMDEGKEMDDIKAQLLRLGTWEGTFRTLLPSSWSDDN